MKKTIFLNLIFLLFLTLSCGTLSWTWDRMIKSRITAQEAIEYKEKIDTTVNPAQKALMLKDIKNKLIELKNVLVKDIVPSTNIYYNFAVIIELPSKKGKVDFFIYVDNDNIDDIAILKKGVSRVNVIGYFGRYFEILSDAYTNIEVLHADIALLKNKESAEKKTLPVQDENTEKKKSIE